jgi:hypothetical protein
MHAIHPGSTERDHRDDYEPVARWENEGGACAERDDVPRPAHGVEAAQDGHATARL